MWLVPGFCQCTSTVLLQATVRTTGYVCSPTASTTYAGRHNVQWSGRYGAMTNVRHSRGSCHLQIFINNQLSKTLRTQPQHFWTWEAKGRISPILIWDMTRLCLDQHATLSRFYFQAQLHRERIRTCNHLHHSETEILRNITYYLKNDKIGLGTFCFSCPGMYCQLLSQ